MSRASYVPALSTSNLRLIQARWLQQQVLPARVCSVDCSLVSLWKMSGPQLHSCQSAIKRPTESSCHLKASCTDPLFA